MAGGVGAVVIVSDHDVQVVTAAQEWRGILDGHPSLPGSHDALVAGLIPVLLEGWSWPDTLRHAIALGAAADSAGEVDLDAYDMLLSEVAVDQARRLSSPAAHPAATISPGTTVRATDGATE